MVTRVEDEVPFLKSIVETLNAFITRKKRKAVPANASKRGVIDMIRIGFSGNVFSYATLR